MMMDFRKESLGPSDDSMAGRSWGKGRFIE